MDCHPAGLQLPECSSFVHNGVTTDLARAKMMTSSNIVLLKVEPDSLRRTGKGTISGRVYLQTNKGGFPGVDWSDIVVAVLCAWLDAINLVSAGSKFQKVHFMDGPYHVELTHEPQGMISLLLVEDREGGRRQEFSATASASTLRNNAREAADLILTKCRQLGWLNSDIDQLGQLRDQTSL